MDRFADLRGKVLPLLRPYVKKVSVFGSFARGEDTPESDIDSSSSSSRVKCATSRVQMFGLWDELEEILAGK